MLADYHLSAVETKLSPKETMPGDNYIEVGAGAAKAVALAVSASQLSEVRRVLDLPCGHGRVLRHLIHLFPKATVDACDLDRDGVEFCARTFGARPIFSQEDLTKVSFEDRYDLIWIGSLFTHTSYEITKKWLAFLAEQLTENGIIVATFHGRWATVLHRLVPYTDAKRWDAVMDGYQRHGYGYQDLPKEQSHDFIQGSYGLSVAHPSTIIQLAASIPKTRIIMFQERAWGGNHDVLVIGKPDWNEAYW